MIKRALYFGCRGANVAGHYLQEGSKTLHNVPPELRFWARLMDGGLLKNGNHLAVNGNVHWCCGGREGLWYAFFWWDRSGDSRPGSNSGFYVHGFGPDELTPETTRANAVPAFAYACEQYPAVIQRQRFPLVLQP